MLGASGVAIFAGAGLLATVFVALSLVLDASFGAALTHAGGLVVAIGLVWLAAGAAFDEHQRVSADRPWFNPLAAILLWSLAVWWDWMAMVTWPIVAGRATTNAATPGARQRGPWPRWSSAPAAFPRALRVDGRRGAGAVLCARCLPRRGADALVVAFDSRPRMPIGSYVSADLTLRLAYLVMALMQWSPDCCFGDSARWWCRAIALSGGLVPRAWGLPGRNGRPRRSASRFGRSRRWRRWGSPGSRSRVHAGPGRR